MKRVFTLGILIIICFVLQTALFPYIEIAGTAPDLMLILTVSFGLMRGRKEGMLVGFFCGFLYDLYFGYAIGPFMILYMILGYCNGFFHRLYLVEDVLLPMLIILIDDLFFNFATYIIFFLLRNRLEFSIYLKDIILPEMIYTAFNIKAEEAYRIGLVNAVYPQEELLAAAKKLANKIASNAPIAVRACKKAINEGLQVDMDQAIVVEEKAFGSCFETEDQKAGMGNFLEKDKAKKLKVVPFQNK